MPATPTRTRRPICPTLAPEHTGVSASDITALHRQHAGALYALCLRILADRGDAEDAVQETFLIATRSWWRLRLVERPFPWLYRVATNVSLRMIRTRRRRPAIPIDNADHIAHEHPGTERALVARRTLEQLVDTADARTLRIVVAVYLHGMGQDEVARELGISRRAVVKRLTRLRQTHTRLLEELET